MNEQCLQHDCLRQSKNKCSPRPLCFVVIFTYILLNVIVPIRIYLPCHKSFYSRRILLYIAIFLLTGRMLSFFISEISSSLLDCFQSTLMLFLITICKRSRTSWVLGLYNQIQLNYCFFVSYTHQLAIVSICSSIQSTNQIYLTFCIQMTYLAYFFCRFSHQIFLTIVCLDALRPRDS